VERLQAPNCKRLSLWSGALTHGVCPGPCASLPHMTCELAPQSSGRVSRGAQGTCLGLPLSRTQHLGSAPGAGAGGHRAFVTQFSGVGHRLEVRTRPRDTSLEDVASRWRPCCGP
jgi:hypothetical protein